MPARKALHLLALMDTTIVSGPLRQLVASLEDLRRDHAVAPLVMLCTRRGRDASPVRAFLDAHAIPMIHVEENGRLDWRVLRRYRAQLRDPRIDIVQTHGYKPAVFVWLLRRLGSGRHLPWIAFFHGRTYESRAIQLFDSLGILCSHEADRIVVVAGTQRRHFTARDPDVVHIPNALTTTPATGAVPAGGDEGPIDLLAAGRLSHEKGFDVLLMAVDQLRQRGRCLRVTLVGDGPERVALERQIIERDLGLLVTMAGHQPSIAPWLQRARLVCLPSRTEGMPNVLLEALAAGVPVVATPVGDIPSVLTDDLGRLVPVADAHALADAIIAELDGPRGEAFQHARNEFLARYDRQGRARRLRTLYDSVLTRVP